MEITNQRDPFLAYAFEYRKPSEEETRRKIKEDSINSFFNIFVR